MSRGPGRIERAIMEEIQNDNVRSGGGKLPVRISGWTLAYRLYQTQASKTGKDWHWRPSIAQLKAVTRAMHSFVRKHQQYALMGGEGRKRLYLYDAADPLSVRWAEMTIARREFVPFMEVERAIEIERAKKQ